MPEVIKKLSDEKNSIVDQYKKGYIKIGLCQAGLFLLVLSLIGLEFLLPASPVAVVAETAENTSETENGELAPEDSWFNDIDFSAVREAQEEEEARRKAELENSNNSEPTPTPSDMPEVTTSIDGNSTPQPTAESTPEPTPEQTWQEPAPDQTWTDPNQQWTDPNQQWVDPNQQWVDPNATGSTWNGAVLTASTGTVVGPSGKETYYNLPMGGVINNTRAAGVQGNYWVRDDGAKMYGDYILAACDVTGMVHNRYDIVNTSMGQAICADTGTFAYDNPYQVDIATTW